MAKTRRRYPEDFKRDAVNLLISSGKSVAQIGRELGIPLYNLSRWKTELMGRRDPDTDQEDPAERLRRLERDNDRLQKDNARLAQENDILKKSLGIVSRR